MSWQKCPVCDGTGIANTFQPGVAWSEKCTVCQGQKIIHSETGKPPKHFVDANTVSVRDEVVTPEKNPLADVLAGTQCIHGISPRSRCQVCLQKQGGGLGGPYIR